jgi:hypothetical protein
LVRQAERRAALASEVVKKSGINVVADVRNYS